MPAVDISTRTREQVTSYACATYAEARSRQSDDSCRRTKRSETERKLRRRSLVVYVARERPDKIMDVEQDKALTAAINAIDQARDQAHATLGEVYRTLDSRFVNQAEDLRAAGRPDGRSWVRSRPITPPLAAESSMPAT